MHMYVSDKILGFLSPDGVFYPCNQFEHSTIAFELLQKIDIQECDNPEVNLANLGWMTFQSNFAGIQAEIRPIPALTDQQVDWIIEHYEQINRKQRYFISEKLKFDQTYKKRKLPEGIDNVGYSGLI